MLSGEVRFLPTLGCQVPLAVLCGKTVASKHAKRRTLKGWQSCVQQYVNIFQVKIESRTSAVPCLAHVGFDEFSGQVATRTRLQEISPAFGAEL